MNYYVKHYYYIKRYLFLVAVVLVSSVHVLDALTNQVTTYEQPVDTLNQDVDDEKVSTKASASYKPIVSSSVKKNTSTSADQSTKVAYIYEEAY